jgi:hypothetical protein
MTTRAALLALSLAAAAGAQTPAAKQLDEVARIASAMVDGDVARRIQTPRSVAAMLDPKPVEPWAASDNYDVDHQSFLAVKKTLIRLARLCDGPCDVNLWMPVATDPPRIQIVIRNVHEMSQFWPWGRLQQEMPPEMKQVLATGKRLTVTRQPGMTSVLAPVYDSLGDIAGLVEVVGRDRPDPQENVL